MGNLQVVFPEDMHALTMAASSADPLYPALNAKNPAKPAVTWRSTGTASEWLRGDAGSSVTIAGVAVLNTTAVIADVQTSPNATTWTTRSSIAVVAVNPWTQRNTWMASFTGVAARYARMSVSTSSNPLYVEAGGLLAFSAIYTFDQNFGRLGLDPQRAQTVIPYVGGGSEGNSEGDLGMVYAFGKDHWYRTQGNTLGLLQRLARLQPNQSVLFFENNGVGSEVYLCRLASRSPFDVNFKTVGFQLQFEERI